jgi:hypothetical protein
MARILRLILLGGTLALGLICTANRGYAQRTDWAAIYAKNDKDVAKRSGLTQSQVRVLRQLAGISEDSGELVQRVDTSYLSRKNVLVLSAYGGTAQCVSFWVFSLAGDSFKLIWDMGEAGDEANFCADPRCSLPQVGLRENLDVVVSIPSFRRGKCSVRSSGRFHWNGSGYTFRGISPVPDAK